MYKISKPLMTVLVSEQKEYRKEWLRKNSFFHLWTKDHESYTEENFEGITKMAKAYLLAGNGSEITSVIPIENPNRHGCKMMPDVDSYCMGMAMSQIPVGMSFMGLARIGAFHTHSTRSMGYTKDQLRKINLNSIFLSLGRNGVLLEKAIARQEIHKLKLKVV